MSDDIIQFVKREYWLNPDHAAQGLESADGEDYRQCLAWLSTKLPLTNFIEIGSAWGASFHLWGTLVHGKKISVDAMPNSVPYQYPDITQEQLLLRNAKWSTHFDNVHSVLADAHANSTVDTVRTILAGDKVDWLYIDAEHSYESAQTEFDLYKQFVRPGGYIGFHDIQLLTCDGVRGGPGCGLFWNELRDSEKYECVELVGKDTKIGILKFLED
jgi:Methyltransferase domain